MMEKKEIQSPEIADAAIAELGTSYEKGAIEATKKDDKALLFIQEHGASGPISPEDDKRILRKIDTRLLPMMIFTLMMQFLDKNALSNSVNFGLTADMGLHGTQYNWASGSIFYIMYLVAQPLVARFLQIWPIGKYLGASIMVWGAILMCIAACRSFAALMVCRALLGVVESCVNPAFMIITAQWYTRDEQPERTAWWNMGLSVAQIFGGLMSYGIGHIHYKSYNPWMWFFIIYGTITIVWGAFVIWWFPDSPMTARWLSVEDRILAVERVRKNKTGIVNTQWKWEQFWECMKDPQTWFQFSTQILSGFPSGGVSSFGSIVVKGFGFSALNTTLLLMPLGVVQATSFLVAGRLTAKFKNIRLLLSWIAQIPPLIGTVLLYTLPSTNRIGRLLSYYIIQTHNVQYIFQMALLGANTAGYTKKATQGAILFISYCVALITGPQIFKPSEAPVYKTAFLSNFVCFALLIVTIWIWQGYLMWQNRRRDKLVEREGLDPINEDYDEGFHDRTDWQQRKTFRYVW